MCSKDEFMSGWREKLGIEKPTHVDDDDDSFTLSLVGYVVVPYQISGVEEKPMVVISAWNNKVHKRRGRNGEWCQFG
jgi:hypothetical protein